MTRSEQKIAWLIAGGAGLALVVFTVAAHVGLVVSGSSGSWNPVALVIELAREKAHLSTKGWIITAAITIVMLGIVTAVSIAIWYRKSPSKRGDEAARMLGGKRASQSVRGAHVEAKAKSFNLPTGFKPGFPLGRAVADGGPIMGDWEMVVSAIAGPRTGKTSAIAIPMILSTTGPVLATSNKRDIVDATVGVREKRTNSVVWIFDPSGIRKSPAKCYWDMLTYVRDSDHYDGSLASRAYRLAGILGDAARGSGNAKFDAFWDGGGDRIRSQLIAAAAVGGKTMSDVYSWATAETDDEPVEILRENNLETMARALEASINLPTETRGGMWACARLGLEWIEDPAFEQWWTPGGGRAEFVPSTFVTSSQTLYSLSRDTSQATPLVAALTAVTTLAAESFAEKCGGRLPAPMMTILDEAANVCPWRDLPKLYSHFGSKGIILVTILQSWSQGVDVWGETGMSKLWSASNIAIYAGGMKEISALDNISKLIGTHYVDQESTSHGAGSSTTSISYASQERPIARVDELASLPEWRAWLFATHSRPILLELVPWFMTSDKEDVQDSLARYGA